MASTKAEPVYTWAFKSSKPRAGGELIDYITRLNDDGKLSCNCPGWIFHKNKGNRECKHTRDPRVANEYKNIFKQWKAGEELPILDLGEGVTSLKLKTSSSKPTHGRVLDLEA